MTSSVERASIRYSTPQDQPGWVKWTYKGVIRIISRICNTLPFLLWRRYGEYMWKGALKEPVYSLRTFMVDVHVTANPAIMKAFLDLHRNGPTFSTQGDRKQAFVFLMEAIFPKFNGSNNDSMMSCDEEHSLRFRSLLHKTFTTQKIEEQQALVKSIIDSTLQKWEGKKRIHLQDETRLFTAELVGKLFLGFDGPYEKISEAINSHLIEYMSRAGWKQGNTKPTPDEEKAFQAVLETVQVIFDKAKNPDTPPSLIKTMIKEKFTDQEISSMIITLLIAGQDTMANLINYILIQVALDPTIHHFFRTGAITTKMLIAEGLRMMPPASFIARVPGKELAVQLGDETAIVEKGSLFAASPVFLGKNPTLIPGSSVNLFLPHRWNDKELPNHLTELPWFPMGGGAHQCVGHKVANFNMTLFLEKILTRYDLKTSLNQCPPNITKFTTRLEGDLPLELKLKAN